MERLRIVHTLVHVLLLMVIVLFVLTGFGITNYQIVEPLTFGALSKLTAYQIHINLIIPFLILLGTHFVLIVARKLQKKT
jgi:thiosulfate reductase cytochrome b subunit